MHLPSILFEWYPRPVYYAIISFIKFIQPTPMLWSVGASILALKHSSIVPLLPHIHFLSFPDIYQGLGHHQDPIFKS